MQHSVKGYRWDWAHDQEKMFWKKCPPKTEFWNFADGLQNPTKCNFSGPDIEILRQKNNKA